MYKQSRCFVYEETKQVGDLPVILDDMSLAFQIGIHNKTLWSLIIKTKDSVEKTKLYQRYKIPKPDGSTRTIYEPSTSFPKNYNFKQVLKSLSVLLFKNYEWPEYVDAYVLGKSQKDSAAKHSGQKTLIALDISNFFPSCTEKMIKYSLKYSFGYCNDIAGIIAKLVTLEGKLPQGSPISPPMANLVAINRFDRKIVDYVEAGGWTYSRYCDDILISHPEELEEDKINETKEKLFEIVSNAGFSVAGKKSRVYGKGFLPSHRWLGMTINEKPNYPQESYRKLRAMLYNAATEGLESRASTLGMEKEKLLQQLRGVLSYVKDKIEPGRLEKLTEWFEIAKAKDTVKADIDTIYQTKTTEQV